MLGYGAAQKFLMTSDAEERDRISSISSAVKQLMHDMDLERANMVANAVGRMLGG